MVPIQKEGLKVMGMVIKWEGDLAKTLALILEYE